MTTRQNALAYVSDRIKQGLLTVDQANVEIVRMVGVEVVEGKMIGSVRKALNEAVKSGYLGKVKKGYLRPEIYYHPNSKTRALETQDRLFREAVEAVKSCLA